MFKALRGALGLGGGGSKKKPHRFDEAMGRDVSHKQEPEGENLFDHLPKKEKSTVHHTLHGGDKELPLLGSPKIEHQEIARRRNSYKEMQQRKREPKKKGFFDKFRDANPIRKVTKVFDKL